MNERLTRDEMRILTNMAGMFVVYNRGSESDKIDYILAFNSRPIAEQKATLLKYETARVAMVEKGADIIS